MGLKSDLKAKHELHKFCNWYACYKICEWCFAVRMPLVHCLNYRHLVGPEALHRLTLMSHADYLRNTPQDKLSPWTDHPDWDIRRNHHDNLHLLFQGGVCKDISATGLMELAAVEHFFLPGVQDTELQLQEAYRRFKTFCKRKGYQYTTVWVFTETALMAHGPPQIPNRVKASAAMYLTFWMCEVASEAAALPGASTRAFHRASLFAGMVGFLSVQQKNGTCFLSEEEVKECKRFGEMFLSSYHILSKTVPSREDLVWHMRPKLHYFQHQISDLTIENPHSYACWLEEDFVGKIGNLISKTHRATACKSSLLRYISFMVTRWFKAKSPGFLNSQKRKLSEIS